MEGSAAFPVLQLSGFTDGAEQSGYWRGAVISKTPWRHRVAEREGRQCCVEG